MEVLSCRCSALRKVRKSKASEFRCIQPDGPARNSPLQEAKHVPFFAIGNGKKSYWIDRGIRLSNFPPKSQRKGIVSPFWLFFPACKFIADSCIRRGKFYSCLDLGNKFV